MEGKSLAPIFKGEKREGHDFIAWRTPKGRAISDDIWKLVKQGDSQPWELYNLVKDGGETNNLAKKHPQRVQEMSRQYEIWRKRVGAN